LGFYLVLVYSLYLWGVSLVMGGLSFAWTGRPETQIYFWQFSLVGAGHNLSGYQMQVFFQSAV